MVVFIESRGFWWSWRSYTRLGPRVGAEAGAERFALHSGPRAQPGGQVVSIYFYFALHETTLVSRFLTKIVVNTTKTVQKIIEIQVTK